MTGFFKKIFDHNYIYKKTPRPPVTLMGYPPSTSRLRTYSTHIAHKYHGRANGPKIQSRHNALPCDFSALVYKCIILFKRGYTHRPNSHVSELL